MSFTVDDRKKIVITVKKKPAPPPPTVTPPQVKIIDVSYPATVYVGDMIPVSVTVQNVGGEGVAVVEVNGNSSEWYLSEGDTYTFKFNIPAVKEGTLTLTIKAGHKG